MRLVIALIAGAVFGLGLTLSDMIDPARVLAFLNVAGGAWDPTLAFVMGGALVPMVAAWSLTGRLRGPVLAPRFPARPTSGIDGRLIGGSALFGLGWGVVGLCPGPALAALSLGGWPVWLFCVAMLAGMAAFNMVDKAGQRRAARA